MVGPMVGDLQILTQSLVHLTMTYLTMTYVIFSTHPSANNDM